MAKWKSGGQKGCIARWDAMIGHIGVLLHHLRSHLGAIKLTVLRVFVYGVEYFIPWTIAKITLVN